MATVVTYLLTSVAFSLIALFFRMATRRSPKDKRNFVVSEAVPEQKAVVHTFASAKIKGTVDEVFAAILDFNSYPTWSPSAIYEWKDTDEKGVPFVGSMGTFKVFIYEVTRYIPVRLNVLDRKTRVLSEESTSYPNWLLRSERTQEVVPLDGKPGFCEYRTQHNLFGLASYYLLLTSKEDLQDNQTQYARELKFFVEGRKHFKSIKK